ncbi:MAG: translation initiation factor IF-3 [Planctomycetes bacterium]|nr:translation initiation factor IF-3 [Planctomycetota bacterium]
MKQRVNEEIRIRQVRLIDDQGVQHGVVDTESALSLARERGLDLVEVAPEAHPPVCKILDYGKFKYLLKKKEHQARRKQHQVVIKEMRVRPKIDTHDLETKLKQARGFLMDGDKLQVNMLFRGREIGFKELGMAIMVRIRETLADVGKVERAPIQEGNRLIMIINPTGHHGQPAPPRPKPE